MSHLLRALLHRWRTGHRMWHDSMTYPGSQGTVWFCLDCRKEFWPIDAPDYQKTNIRRTPPWEEK